MIYKQCKLYDKENNIYFGGIACYTAEIKDGGMLEGVICAYCGGYIESSDINEDDLIQLVEVYDFWVDFTDTIIDNTNDWEWKGEE